MKYTANLRPVQAYELLGADGLVADLLFVSSQWEGMAKMESADGRHVLIIEAPGAFEESFRRSFAHSAFTANVLKASPELSALIAEKTEAQE